MLADGLYFSVVCAEDVARVDRAAARRAAQRTFLGDYLISEYDRACAAWPHASIDPEFDRPLRSEAPTLLFSGGLDPVTPPAYAEAVAAHLGRSVHIVFPDSHHGVDTHYPCVNAIVAQMLERGTVQNLDIGCASGQPDRLLQEFNR